MKNDEKKKEEIQLIKTGMNDNVNLRRIHLLSQFILQRRIRRLLISKE